ncbi:hypothetical protein J6590_012849 [Homalodisca vitripennis]|nr:hypothetical protein J6590_062257 [Homalodisca vitripennis]KAG8322860.1 hypothetical protein J6590_012849 [Homalodisca vitripennis]
MTMTRSCVIAQHVTTRCLAVKSRNSPITSNSKLYHGKESYNKESHDEESFNEEPHSEVFKGKAWFACTPVVKQLLYTYVDCALQEYAQQYESRTIADLEKIPKLDEEAGFDSQVWSGPTEGRGCLLVLLPRHIWAWNIWVQNYRGALPYPVLKTQYTVFSFRLLYAVTIFAAPIERASRQRDLC